MTRPAERHQLTVQDLVEIMQVVMRVGVLMLQSGTVSFRVEQAMQRVALGLGMERLDAYVTLTGITASIHCGHLHYTQIARVKRLGVDMNRLGAVEYLTLHLPTAATPAQLCTLLDKIEQTPPAYPAWMVQLAVAIACGAFAILSGGSGIDGLAACLSAGLGLGLRQRLQQRRLNPIAVTIVCAAVATSICYLIGQGLGLLRLPALLPQASFAAAVLFQVPGMLLVTASLDLVRLDLVSGIARVAYALIQLFSVAIGMLIVMGMTGFSIL
ncbi:threonine/serine exporter family protein [Leptolyngbya sp. NK1-12]|uniref:Threonine/serine exporter family protein n=1 Tax=Leptolyngbya sp. NK1-12 TaxID=2547451 RepID=A0AA97AHD0_9CYAN|nr:threonine/serine exporter family protein [Leptolyngbya sp. NK1-12]WNZ22621.1 threonine/serine exporter family protein [Leptolyngbya sp. NK1-12]